MNGIIYECKSWPESAHCSRAGFEPAGEYSKEAWTVLGHCEAYVVVINPIRKPIQRNDCPNYRSSLCHFGGC
eukprot:scaffold90675_cov43-Cyclotella_meneghiniana.AAC.1